MSELPTITSSTYSASPITMGSGSVGSLYVGTEVNKLIPPEWMQNPLYQKITPQEKPKMSSLRVVKVYIADTNENLPMMSRVLYTGEEKFTDLTDQELFFEIPVTALLATHNIVRGQTIDKKQAEKFGRDIFLEPARIRDLRMVVVAVASF